MINIKSAVQVGNYIVRQAIEINKPVTPMKLLKLVYMCHGWMLGVYHRPLIQEEVEAWQYGPVIRVLYEAVRDYRSQAITDSLTANPGVFDLDEQSVIDQVFSKYGDFSGIKLSQLTHMKGTPWDRTYNLQGQNGVISNDIIEDYYSQLIAENNN